MALVTLIGSGSAATSLGVALQAAGDRILEVWSPTEAHARQLAEHLGCGCVADTAALSKDADIYLLAVRDDAIAETAAKLQIYDKILAHTSGIKSKNLLQKGSSNFGVFYPFVSMTKEAIPDFRSAMLMVEGNNEATVDALQAMAARISDNVRVVEETQRQSLHLAAVFANNFTNHLYAIAENILEEKGMHFDDIRPLIAAHYTNLMKLSPSVLQTGPAMRDDFSTMEKHLKLLKGKKEIEQLYIDFTEDIQYWKQRIAGKRLKQDKGVK